MVRSGSVNEIGYGCICMGLSMFMVAGMVMGVDLGMGMVLCSGIRMGFGMGEGVCMGMGTGMGRVWYGKIG